jgi:hypothetical protein
VLCFPHLTLRPQHHSSSHQQHNFRHYYVVARQVREVSCQRLELESRSSLGTYIYVVVPPVADPHSRVVDWTISLLASDVQLWKTSSLTRRNCHCPTCRDIYPDRKCKSERYRRGLDYPDYEQ